MTNEQIAKEIAKKMKNKRHFSDTVFNEVIKIYTNLSEEEISKIRKHAKEIFDREYSQGMEL